MIVGRIVSVAIQFKNFVEEIREVVKLEVRDLHKSRAVDGSRCRKVQVNQENVSEELQVLYTAQYRRENCLESNRNHQSA